MDPQSIVDSLEPLREPAAVAWWPPAPGWWVVCALLLAVLVWALAAAWRRHRRRAPLRAARRELEAMAADSSAFAASLMALLRRVAFAVDRTGAQARAGVTGSDWVDYLNGLSGDPQRQLGDAFADYAYRPANPADATAMRGDAAQWLQGVERAL